MKPHIQMVFCTGWSCQSYLSWRSVVLSDCLLQVVNSILWTVIAQDRFNCTSGNKSCCDDSVNGSGDCILEKCSWNPWVWDKTTMFHLVILTRISRHWRPSLCKSDFVPQTLVLVFIPRMIFVGEEPCLSNKRHKIQWFFYCIEDVTLGE